MGLEVTTTISGLVATNPVGAVDPKSQGDDHLRLIKNVLKTTFPALSGPMTADQTELNYLDGATGLTGTGNTVRSASPTFTGTILAVALTASGTVAANLFSGSGASLTSLPAANLTGTLPAISGVNLTALNASNIASGSLADARLSANVPLLNAANAFTGGVLSNTNDIDSKATSPGFNLRTGGGTLRGRFYSSGGDQFIESNNSGAGLTISTTGNGKLTFDSGSGALDFKAGPVTTSNSSASEVGYKGLPQNSQSADYTAVLADADKNLHQTGASKTFTIPANGSVAYPIGTALNFTTDNASGVSIAITTDTLRFAGTLLNGTRTLAQYGMATALKVTSTVWLISGAGLS